MGKKLRFSLKTQHSLRLLKSAPKPLKKKPALLCGFFKVWDQRQLKLATRDQDEKINHWQDCKMSGVSNLD